MNTRWMLIMFDSESIEKLVNLVEAAGHSCAVAEQQSSSG
jgi:hypothetical protein